MRHNDLGDGQNAKARDVHKQVSPSAVASEVGGERWITMLHARSSKTVDVAFAIVHCPIIANPNLEPVAAGLAAIGPRIENAA